MKVCLALALSIVFSFTQRKRRPIEPSWVTESSLTEVDRLFVRWMYKSISFVATKIPGSPNFLALSQSAWVHEFRNRAT